MPRQNKRRGPTRIALTASMIKTYKACPRLYELQYIHKLKPEKTSEPLTIGSQYHELVAKILKTKTVPVYFRSIADVMALAFARYLDFEEWGIKDVEQEFSVKLTPFFMLRGKVDAICEDGSIVEHKTTRNPLDDLYLERLAYDDQVSIYLAAQSLLHEKLITRVHYTAVQKPTLRQKQGEPEADFFTRCWNWYTPEKVKSFTVVRTAWEIDDTISELRDLAKEIRNRKLWYRNPSHCMIVDCAYRPICLECDPETLTGFVQKENNNEELTQCRF